MQFLEIYFMNSGLAWAIAGAMFAVMLGGMGSAIGIRISSSQGAGVMSEKPDLFGKLIVLMALPGTQGFYGFITALLVANQIGLLGGTVRIAPLPGLSIFLIGLLSGFVLLRSAINQGEAAAAAINLVARRPDQAGRAIIIPALVETYAVVAFLAALLLIFYVAGDLDYEVAENLFKPVTEAAGQ